MPGPKRRAAQAVPQGYSLQNGHKRLKSSFAIARASADPDDEDAAVAKGQRRNASNYGDISDADSDLSGDFEDLEAGEDRDEDDDDSEINEFELDGAADNDGDDMISDDGEDLYANLDDVENSDDEPDDLDSDSEDEAPAAVPQVAPVASVVPLKKANVRNSKAPKPLTPSELRALAFAELTASPISSVISTQVSAVLDPATPPPAATSPLQPLLKTLHAHITSLPTRKATSLAALRKKGFTVPPVEGVDTKWAKMEFGWEKPRPEDLRVVGRWACGAGIKVGGEYIVEMAVALPQALLQPKDYLFPRFGIKSIHYLITLASQLPDSLGPVQLSYVQLPASRGYALEVRSAHVKGTEKVGLARAKGAVLRICTALPADTFPYNKISPSSNVVRPATADSDSVQVDPSALPATPLHSSSLHCASLPLMLSHLKFHHALASSYGSYAASVRLLQLWAERRSHGASLGISDDWWAWCVARALGGNGVSGDAASAAAGGEAWAGWRRTVEWLAGANWTDGVFFQADAGSQKYSKDQFRRAFGGKPLFVDPTGTVNLAAGIDLSALEMLKQDAKTTISLLLSSADDETKFATSFSRELHPVERFDNYARISVTPEALSSVSASDSLDHPDSLSALAALMAATLHRALRSRTYAFQLSRHQQRQRLPFKGSLPMEKPVIFGLGILLDPTQSMRVVDQGPSAEDEAACAEFSNFWGPKSELRRFKDGSIVETVVWDEQGPNGLGPQRHTVVSRIIKYILGHRHGLAETVEVFSGILDPFMIEPEGVRRAIFLEDSVVTGKGFSSVTTAFDELSKEMMQLPELPLEIASIAPVAPALRYSTTFTPSPRRLKGFESFPESTKHLPVHDMLLTLESSGRWPDDLEGIQKIKSAFLSKIGEGLEATRAVLMANVAFDLEARPVDDNVSLEILTASGFAFRARISFERSLLLHRERKSQLGDVAASPYTAYKRRFVHLPRHHGGISALQHQFTSYSHTVRLVKRWFSTHMLLPHFDEEQIELVVASTFLDPASPYEPAQSGATGFARVMDRLAHWKWRDEPLLVPLYSFQTATSSGRRAAFPTAKRAKARAAFEAIRLADPAVNEHAWIIATEEDIKGQVWGRLTDKVIAARAKSLAKATLKTLNEGVVDGGLVAQQLFTPPLADYNFLIYLNASIIPRHFQALTPEARALSSSRTSVLSGSIMGQPDDDEIRLDWDPVSDFVRDVERLFPSTFLLFYCPDGGSVIGGVWNPSAESAKPFKGGLNVPVTPTSINGESKPKVVLDKQALLAQVERFGKGLVRRIELR